MPEASILQIAQQHVENLNLNNEYSNKFHFSLSEPFKVDEGYFFEYKINMINKESSEAFGGAPALFVSDDGTEVRDIGWGEYNELKNSL